MGILDQIQIVEREFVRGDCLIRALEIQENVSTFYVASWFSRNVTEIERLQFIEFNQQLRDFKIADGCWAVEIFRDILDGTESSADWAGNNPGYVGGWLASELKQFFLASSLKYPEKHIAELQGYENRTSGSAEKESDAAAVSSTTHFQQIDPLDLPAELHAANMAFRAVTDGYGDATATPRNRLIEYLQKQYPAFKPHQVNRIATVANPDKSTGRKKI